MRQQLFQLTRVWEHWDVRFLYFLCDCATRAGREAASKCFRLRTAVRICNQHCSNQPICIYYTYILMSQLSGITSFSSTIHNRSPLSIFPPNFPRGESWPSSFRFPYQTDSPLVPFPLLRSRVCCFSRDKNLGR